MPLFSMHFFLYVLLFCSSSSASSASWHDDKERVFSRCARQYNAISSRDAYTPHVKLCIENRGSPIIDFGTKRLSQPLPRFMRSSSGLYFSYDLTQATKSTYNLYHKRSMSSFWRTYKARVDEKCKHWPRVSKFMHRWPKISLITALIIISPLDDIVYASLASYGVYWVAKYQSKTKNLDSSQLVHDNEPKNE